jgi:hypothetical protein
MNHLRFELGKSASMKTILMLIILLLLSACSTWKKYPSSCTIKLPPEPHYPYKDLKPGDDPDIVFKAMAATIILQNDVIKQYKYIATGEK